MAGRLLGIDLIALPITCDIWLSVLGLWLRSLRARVSELLADRDQVDFGFGGNTRGRRVRKPLLVRLRSGHEAASINYFTALVESTVMARGIPKVDANRRLDLGLRGASIMSAALPSSPWDHGIISPFRDDLLIPFMRTDWNPN
jgi:hypothetical protein